MKAEIRELLTDFKAAVRLGHPDSLVVALDGLRALPEVSGNDAFGEAFIDNVALPLGEILAHPQVEEGQLLALLDDPLTGLRAVGAAALAVRWAAAKGDPAGGLRRAGGDSRAEVRLAVAMALVQGSEAGPERATRLVSSWLGEGSPRLRQTALFVLAGLADGPAVEQTWAQETLGSLERLSAEADPDVRAALVAALVSLAEAGYPVPVLDLLERWSHLKSENAWVIARTLSASWAAEHPERVSAILAQIEARSGPSRTVESARRALERHRQG